MSPWITTYTGREVHLLLPTRDMFEIEDIAHALSNICRYTGHCREFYSVAEHCVHASYLVPPTEALDALMHDAAEAYLSDISSPLKHCLLDYKVIERNLEAVIAAKFALCYPWGKSIKQADLQMLALERQELLASSPTPWSVLEGVSLPKHNPIEAWPPKEAKNKFLDRYVELTSTELQACLSL